jgi:C4-dicarboxylate transporter DctQ subunit
MAHRYEPRTLYARIVHSIEETLIALLMGLMTVITFINVVMRYVFDGVPLVAPLDFIVPPKLEFLWAVEMTGFLFAWLVIVGLAFAVKIAANLGVDAVVALFAQPARRLLALLSAAVCIAYALLLLKGAWDFWAPFANLPPTTGRWFPTGFDTGALMLGWYEVNDTPLPAWLGFLQDWFNDGEEYEKLPRVLPYVILPLGVLHLLLRFLQAGRDVWTGRIDNLIASHEAEEMVEEAARHVKRED